jgi:hypothetical protein
MAKSCVRTSSGDRDDRLASSLERLHFSIDVLELSVTVGMAGAFARLCIGLQAEAQALQEAADQLLARTEAQLGQRRGQMALAPLTHSKGASGSPRIEDCTKSFKAPEVRAAPRSPACRRRRVGARAC